VGPAPDIAEVVASRVVQLLEPVLADLCGPRPAAVLVDAATLAAELGVSRRFVYEHASELGARRLGTGNRARLRFDTDEAKAALQRLDHRSPAPRRELPSPPRPARHGVGELLPIRGTAVE
jgi:hypothetical protein